MTINIVFGISEPLQSELISLSLEIKNKYDLKWWIDNDRYLIHLPLFLFECPEKNKQKVINTAKKFSRDLKKLEIKTKRLFASKRGLIMVEFSVPEILYEYHRKALEIFNPLREGLKRSIYNKSKVWDSLSEYDKKMVQEYGNKWVLDNYKPHITIAKIDSDTEVLSEITENYQSRITGFGCLNKLQVHQPLSNPIDRTELIFSQQLK